MEEHVDLDRKFASLLSQDSGDFEHVKALAEYRSPKIKWADILDRRVTVILGAPGAGKTEELRYQSSIIRDRKEYCFYTTVRSLSLDLLEDCLDEKAAEEFERWKTSSRTAWFFIDSIDEARSSGAEFERALKHLSKSIKPKSHQAHVVITTRPLAWFGSGDRFAVEQHLYSVLNQSREQVEMQTEDLLLDPILNTSKRDRDADEERHELGPITEVAVVWLLPLDQNQIDVFVRNRLPKDGDRFLEELALVDRITPIEYPLDLADAMAYWDENSSFGSKIEQLSWGIQRKLREPDVRRTGNLSVSVAENAAKRLAAGLVLGRKTEFSLARISGKSEASTPVVAEDLLQEMSRNELSEFCNRPLFVVANYGALRLLREYQDYLAADWLLDLVNKDLPLRHLLSIVFATIDGERVLKPTFQTIAPWLAQRNSAFRQHVIRAAPVALFESGDPWLVPEGERENIFLSYIRNLNRRSPFRPLLMDHEARWFSSGLSQKTLREIWKKYDVVEVRILVLAIIGSGDREELLDVALSAARRARQNKRVRSFAIDAIGRLETDRGRAELSVSAEKSTSRWPLIHLADLIDCLLPEHLPISTLGRWLRESVKRQLIEKQDVVRALNDAVPKCSTKQLTAFGRLVLGLAEQRPHDDEHHCPLSRRYNWLLPVLQTICERLVTLPNPQPLLFKSAKLIHNVATYRSEPHVSSTAIVNSIASSQLLKQAFLVFAFRKDSELATSPWMIHHSWPISLSYEDLPWILDLIKDSNYGDIAEHLYSLVFWMINNAPNRTAHRRALGKIAKQSKKFTRLLIKLDGERKRSLAKSRKYEKREQVRRNDRQLRNQQIAQSWLDLQKRVVKKPSRIKSTRGLKYGTPPIDLVNLHKWVVLSVGNRGRYSIAASHRLTSVFSKEVGTAYEDAIRSFWRTQRAPLVSKSEELTNWDTLAMSGIAVEAQLDADWAHRLTDALAETAARYATRELNGFPPWLDDLVVSKPDIVTKVFRDEVKWEIKRASQKDEPYHCASRLAYERPSLKDAFAPLILEELRSQEPVAIGLLERCLTVVLSANIVSQTDIAGIARGKWLNFGSTDRGGLKPNAVLWMAAWMYSDSTAALEALRQKLSECDLAVQDAILQSLLPRLLERDQLAFRCDSASFDDPDVIAQLTKLAYRHIRVSDDERWIPGVVHEHTDRTDQEGARAGIGERASRILGAKGVNLLRTLAGEPYCVSIRRNLLRRADDLATQVADHQPWRELDVTNFESNSDRIIKSQRDLYEVTVNRLLDIKDDLEAGDFSQKGLLAKSLVEIDHQRFLGDKISESTKNRYSIVRENVVVDEKRPDLSIVHPQAGRVAIEVKVADAGWGYRGLIATVKKQVIQKYLADRQARYGILVVIRCKQKTWRDGKRQLSFPQIVSTLERSASKASAASPDIDEVKVISIDLAS